MSRAFRVLCVDDQEDFLQMLSAILGAAGYEPKMTTSGREAVEAVRRGEADALLVDYKMPSMDGIETIRLVRETGSRIPIVLLTVYLEEAMLSALRDYDIAGYVSKMGDLADLLEILRKVRPAA